MPNHATNKKDSPLDSGLWALKALQASNSTIANGTGETLPETVDRFNDYTENIINNIHDRAVFMCRKVAKKAQNGNVVLYHDLVYIYYNYLEHGVDQQTFEKLASQVIFSQKGPARKILENALAGGYLAEPLFVYNNTDFQYIEEPIGPGLDAPEMPEIPAAVTERHRALRARPRYVWRIIIPTTLEEYHIFQKRLKLRLQAMGVNVDEAVAPQK